MVTLQGTEIYIYILKYPISFGKGTTSSNVSCQGKCYTPRKLTVYPVCPWKMMVGRLPFLLKCSLFRCHSFIFVGVVPWRQRLTPYIFEMPYTMASCAGLLQPKFALAMPLAILSQGLLKTPPPNGIKYTVLAHLLTVGCLLARVCVFKKNAWNLEMGWMVQTGSSPLDRFWPYFWGYTWYGGMHLVQCRSLYCQMVIIQKPCDSQPRKYSPEN